MWRRLNWGLRGVAESSWFEAPGAKRAVNSWESTACLRGSALSRVHWRLWSLSCFGLFVFFPSSFGIVSNANPKKPGHHGNYQLSCTPRCCSQRSVRIRVCLCTLHLPVCVYVYLWSGGGAHSVN